MTTCPKCNGAGKFTVSQGLHSIDLQCSYCFGVGNIAARPLIYAGVGARVTPIAVAREMESLAMTMALKGMALRSGRGKRPYNAAPDTDSADLAFERGCSAVGGRKVIRTATQQESALEHASRYHPAWDRCDDSARGLHARNSLVMMGDWLDDPVSLVVCWTEGGAVKGGTGQALRIAADIGVPVFNLALSGHGDALREWLAS